MTDQVRGTVCRVCGGFCQGGPGSFIRDRPTGVNSHAVEGRGMDPEGARGWDDALLRRGKPEEVALYGCTGAWVEPVRQSDRFVPLRGGGAMCVDQKKMKEEDVEWGAWI